MAARQSNRKSTKRHGASSSGKKPTSKSQSPMFRFTLRPEHQRELFALGLIAVALITIIFFLTGKTGGVGTIYLLGVQQMFGSGSLVVPLALGVLGIAILIQERIHDSELSGAHVLGTLIVLSMLLAMLEFPLHTIALTDQARFGKGGGLVGFTMVELLDQSIGRPAAILIVTMLMLIGILLTFNMTLREFMTILATNLHQIWIMVWGDARSRSEKAQQKPLRMSSNISPQRAEPIPANDIISTPIAERPTRASLFRRPETDMATTTITNLAATNGTTTSPPIEAPVAKQEKPVAQPVALAGKKPEQPPPPEMNRAKVQEQFESFDIAPIHLTWPLPPIDLLDKPVEGKITQEEEQVRSLLIEETLASFKVEAQVVGVNVGPAITQFELQPAVGVKISKITTLEKDLALALAAPTIRIEAPIPGKSVVGIEVPNSSISLVTLREVIDSKPFELHRGKLKIPLGKDVSGIPTVADMTKMPHLLVAGSTGSGKSVAINAFLCGLLLKHTPDELRLIMVDPKMVELIVYNRIPHLLSPVVTELERVVPTLKWATREMERRYKMFAKFGCRNLESYQKRAREKRDMEQMPYILIIIDELADLMMMAPDEVETQICRLAQMARATGIHLIIATQRPSVDVITGLIKANFPSRVAFAVTSQIDSRVILDAPGAERLLGRGDMLYMAVDSAKLVRMQGTYVSDREVEQIVNFWRNAVPPQQGDKEAKEQKTESAAKEPAGKPQSETQEIKTFQPSFSTAAQDTETFDAPDAYLTAEEQELLLPQALGLVKQHKRASASLLQRRLRIGYSKAAQLIDLLEQQGIVGPAEEGRSREVLQQAAEDDL